VRAVTRRSQVERGPLYRERSCMTATAVRHLPWVLPHLDNHFGGREGEHNPRGCHTVSQQCGREFSSACRASRTRYASAPSGCDRVILCLGRDHRAHYLKLLSNNDGALWRILDTEHEAQVQGTTCHYMKGANLHTH